ncbi:hypothetical protein HanPSC8_Chr01g0020961 [Helianthus annuus]|nr:hypothetical protein HanPSC8_Chr01g0020961 [Helianthus annuus]
MKQNMSNGQIFLRLQEDEDTYDFLFSTNVNVNGHTMARRTELPS